MTAAVRGALQIAFFFAVVCYGWLLFRANSLQQIAAFSQALVDVGSWRMPSVVPKPPFSALLGLALLIALQVAEHLDGRLDVIRFWPRPVQGLLCALGLWILVMGTSNAPVQFIYFQF